jgi:hypothetical protein
MGVGEIMQNEEEGIVTTSTGSITVNMPKKGGQNLPHTVRDYICFYLFFRN